VNKTDSGSDFLILNLQMVTRVEVRNFKDEQHKHQARVFFSEGGSVNLVGADADRVLSALEDFTAYPRLKGLLSSSVSQRTYSGLLAASRACSSGGGGKNAVVGHKIANEGGTAWI
jgi:hypothetical protein